MDFSAENVCSNPQVLNQLHKAFVDIGFVFIINHGIEKHKVSYTSARPLYRAGRCRPAQKGGLAMRDYNYMYGQESITHCLFPIK